MISAFSDLFAFLGSPAITLAVIAHRSSAVAAPISSMLSMDTGLPTKWAGGWFNLRIVRYVEVASTGY